MPSRCCQKRRACARNDGVDKDAQTMVRILMTLIFFKLARFHVLSTFFEVAECCIKPSPTKSPLQPPSPLPRPSSPPSNWPPSLPRPSRFPTQSSDGPTRPRRCPVPESGQGSRERSPRAGGRVGGGRRGRLGRTRWRRRGGVGVLRGGEVLEMMRDGTLTDERKTRMKAHVLRSGNVADWQTRARALVRAAYALSSSSWLMMIWVKKEARESSS